MGEYRVVGNLFWAADVYARYDGTAYQYIEDYYDGSASRFPQVNGDGYLFYPGAPYGIFGPVASLRLEAIRDGNEEYELFYALEQVYNAAGFNKDNIVRNLAQSIYTGTRVATDSERFYAARKALIQLTMLAQEGVAVTNVADDNRGTVTYTVYAPAGSVVKSNGAALSPVAQSGSGSLYEAAVLLNGDSNALALSVVTESGETAFTPALGGKATPHAASALANAFGALGAAVTATQEGDKVRLDISEVAGKQQSITVVSELLSAVNQGSKKLALHLVNPTDEALTLRLLVKFTGWAASVELASVTLQPGANDVIADGIAGLNWIRYVAVERLELYFSAAAGDWPARTVLFDGFTVYQA
ncbi:MAG: DUF4091 domain-containing protein [Clostridiales bacterium]|nr:DUF4091 domain-containing protein [Clostridiales bacterium]